MVCRELCSHQSIEASSAGWDLWLHPDFCRELLKRHLSQQEVDRVCESIVDRALDEGDSFTRAEFVVAVKSVLPEAKKYQIDNFRRRRPGPWKVEAGRRRKKIC
jgi:hypothetical protein